MTTKETTLFGIVFLAAAAVCVSLMLWGIQSAQAGEKSRHSGDADGSALIPKGFRGGFGGMGGGSRSSVSSPGFSRQNSFSPARSQPSFSSPSRSSFSPRQSSPARSAQSYTKPGKTFQGSPGMAPSGNRMSPPPRTATQPPRTAINNFRPPAPPSGHGASRVNQSPSRIPQPGISTLQPQAPGSRGQGAQPGSRFSGQKPGSSNFIGRKPQPPASNVSGLAPGPGGSRFGATNRIPGAGSQFVKPPLGVPGGANAGLSRHPWQKPVRGNVSSNIVKPGRMPSPPGFAVPLKPGGLGSAGPGKGNVVSNKPPLGIKPGQGPSLGHQPGMSKPGGLGGPGFKPSGLAGIKPGGAPGFKPGGLPGGKFAGLHGGWGGNGPKWGPHGPGFGGFGLHGFGKWNFGGPGLVPAIAGVGLAGLIGHGVLSGLNHAFGGWGGPHGPFGGWGGGPHPGFWGGPGGILGPWAPPPPPGPLGPWAPWGVIPSAWNPWWIGGPAPWNPWPIGFGMGFFGIGYPGWLGPGYETVVFAEDDTDSIILMDEDVYYDDDEMPMALIQTPETVLTSTSATVPTDVSGPQTLQQDYCGLLYTGPVDVPELVLPAELHNKGVNSYRNAEYVSAEDLLSTAIRELERTGLGGHVLSALAIENLACVYEKTGRADSAGEAREAARKIREAQRQG